ncbi:MAG: hypothetical protein WDO18_02625 [Acidobacteriota bacterium]
MVRRQPLSRNPLPIAAGALPFACNYFFNMGFWNYCYGVVFALFAFGAYLRSRRAEISVIWFVVLALATFFFHVFHVVAFGWLAVAVLALAARELLGAPQSAVSNGRSLRPFLLLVAGILVLTILFLYWLLFDTDGSVDSGPGLLRRLRAFLFMTYAAGYGEHEVMWLAFFLLAFGAWILLGCRKRLQAGSNAMDALLGAGAAFAAASFVLPDSFGDASYVVIRLMMLAWLCVLLWLASLPGAHAKSPSSPPSVRSCASAKSFCATRPMPGTPATWNPSIDWPPEFRPEHPLLHASSATPRNA